MKKFMYLYHGTTVDRLPAILKKGILPREVHGFSNYSGETESKSGLVYLSQYFPVAYAAAFGEREESHDVAVLRVRVNTSHLYPDEDFIGRALAMQENRGHDMKYVRQIMEDVDPRDYKKHWPDSLKFIGNVSIPKVDKKDITGHFVIGQMDVHTLMALGYDTNPYALVGARLPAETAMGKFRDRLEFVFEHGLDAFKADRDKRLERLKILNKITNRNEEEETEYMKLIWG